MPMTRYEAYITKNWDEHGLAHLAVARIRDAGSADYGIFLVDAWCLGVKDAFSETDVTEADVRELLDERLPDAMREPIHPACAKKLIDGALAYAERLGFAPHRDFRKARRVLSGLDASVCPSEFVYGRDSRPCYAPGPDDSDERVTRVLAILNARLGEEGYDYEPADFADEDEDEQAAREALMTWLDAEPPDVPRFYVVSGMVAAAHICPELSIQPMHIVEALWSPHPPIWKDREEAQDFLNLLKSYWNYTASMVLTATGPDAGPYDQVIDLWFDEFPADDPVPLIAASMQWAGGFLRTTELWPEAWGDALTRPDLATHWEIVRWWAEFLSGDNKDRIADAGEATPPRTLSGSITALARALRMPPSSE